MGLVLGLEFEGRRETQYRPYPVRTILSAPVAMKACAAARSGISVGPEGLCFIEKGLWRRERVRSAWEVLVGRRWEM